MRSLLLPTHCGREPVVAGLWYAAMAARCGWDSPASSTPSNSSPPEPHFLVIATLFIVAASSAAPSWPGNGGQASKQEGPLARGAAAERLVERAQAWAQRHPNDAAHRPEQQAAHTARGDPQPPAQ
jgi:hypothetical protein